ncbi:SAM-dependent methyltransferase [Roseiconus nitratireducens]|uniref:SAM-dependent methyltransferase n=2 Tax=Roseiconus nitratireducens TaxID=2605748 RepID=A0A5M6CZV7_9BACT|nr:SAM-dependent methyltransferase [Roseiconus nitratireducens]
MPRSRRRGEDAAELPSKPSKPTKSRPQKLRIIGGSMRGRTVVYHGGTFTRPMRDSVRENLFNLVGMAVRGAVAIDLFAGTGALSFESLSRGASRAIAIEKSRHAAGFLKSTAETLGVTNQLTVLNGDAFRLGAGVLGPASPNAPLDDTPRLVLLCPPYAMWDSMNEQLRVLIRLAMEHSPPGSLIVAETDKHFDESRLPPGDWDHRVYGGTRLSLIEPLIQCGLRS